MDTAGNLYAASGGQAGKHIAVFGPTGKLRERITLPMQLATNLVFDKNEIISLWVVASLGILIFRNHYSSQLPPAEGNQGVLYRIQLSTR